VFHYCCSDDDETEQTNEHHDSSTVAAVSEVDNGAIESARIIRDRSPSNEGSSGNTTNNHINDMNIGHNRGNNEEDENGHSPHCCREQSGIHEWFRRIRVRWAGVSNDVEYDAVASVDPSTPIKPIPPSPLRQASSFDSSRDIPTILAKEVVLPGSQLQKEIAKLMAAAKITNDTEEECVICMEGFDPSNPRMPTLCGCGENKTYFHLPCLYQWLEQSSECPSCRQTITWEEF
jgi:hypothetical protein